MATCDSCNKHKSDRQRPIGLLQPLPVPEHPWHTITMDFITSLPNTPDGKDTVVVFVDKLTEMCHLYPTTAKGLDSKQVAHIFLNEVFRHHGIPVHIVSDRDVRFANDF